MNINLKKCLFHATFPRRLDGFTLLSYPEMFPILHRRIMCMTHIAESGSPFPI